MTGAINASDVFGRFSSTADRIPLDKNIVQLIEEESATISVVDHVAPSVVSVVIEKTRGDLAAKGFESVAARAGSVDGILGALKDTAGKTGQNIADLGFKVTAVAGAFSLGYDAGTKFRSFFKEITGSELPNFSDSIANSIAGVTNLGNVFLDLPTKMNPALAALAAADAAAASASGVTSPSGPAAST